MKNLEKQKQRDQRELAKWYRENERRPIKGYVILIFIVLCIVKLLDEFATSAPNSVQTATINEFFVNMMGKTFDEGLSYFSLLTILMIPMSILSMIYVSLCDRFGRRIMLIISVCGMAMGTAICMWSPSFLVYFIGRLIITFFIATDIHQVIIIEIVPNNKRATYMHATSVFGSLGIMTISFARMANTTDGILNWRGVFVVPAIACMICAVLVITTCRETKPFLDKRIAYLSKPIEVREEERVQAKKDKAQAAAESGIVPAFKYIFSHKQPKMCFIASAISGLAMMCFASYYESIMSQSGMSVEEVSSALFVYPIAMAVVALAAGYLADKLGRKKAGCILAATSLIALVLFILAAVNKANPYLVGILFGFELGSYYRYGDTLGLTFKESVPTNIRASASAVSGILSAFIIIVGTVVVSIFLGIIGVNATCLIFGGTLLAASLIIFLCFVKETNAVDLKEVG